MADERQFGRVMTNKRLLTEIEQTFKNDYLPSIRQNVTLASLDKLLHIHETIKEQSEAVNDFLVIPERNSFINFLTVNIVAYYAVKISFKEIPYNEYKGVMEVLTEELQLNIDQSIDLAAGFR